MRACCDVDARGGSRPVLCTHLPAVCPHCAVGQIVLQNIRRAVLIEAARFVAMVLFASHGMGIVRWWWRFLGCMFACARDIDMCGVSIFLNVATRYTNLFRHQSGTGWWARCVVSCLFGDAGRFARVWCCGRSSARRGSWHT